MTEFEVEVDGQKMPILEAPLAEPEKVTHDADDPELCEHLVRVEWLEDAAARGRDLADGALHEPDPGLQAARPRDDRVPRSCFRPLLVGQALRSARRA